MIKIIESPREAMQGITPFIPTELKQEWIDSLLHVGYDTVEVGSFVSPKAVFQMSDSEELVNRLEPVITTTKKMLLVVNKRGAESAATLSGIDTISYPFSISPKFSELNLNSTPEKQLEIVNEMYHLCNDAQKEFVVYISMAFGNPYHDEWNLEVLSFWIDKLHQIGVTIIPLSNVTLEIDSGLIAQTFQSLIPAFPSIEFGLHLHTANVGWLEKVEAAYDAGCRRFDAVMQGMGGCPMTGKELLGNLSSENLVEFLRMKGELPSNFNEIAFNKAREISHKISSAKYV